MTLVTPLRDDWWPLLWLLVHEDPQANLDDDAPATLGAFVDEMSNRQEFLLERIWGVLDDDGTPVGVIAFRPLTRRVGAFHGICFTKDVHGTGLPRQAVQAVIEILVMDGYVKIQAGFFPVMVVSSIDLIA